MLESVTKSLITCVYYCPREIESAHGLRAVLDDDDIMKIVRLATKHNNIMNVYLDHDQNDLEKYWDVNTGNGHLR